MAAFVVVPAALAASGWAAKADSVCAAWNAKAKAALGTAQPKTSAAVYAFSVKAVAVERGELAALQRIPGPSAADRKALASVRTDIAEIQVGLNDWKHGNKQGFATVFVRWQHDHRPAAAFAAVGAKTCG